MKTSLKVITISTLFKADNKFSVSILSKGAAVTNMVDDGLLDTPSSLGIKDFLCSAFCPILLAALSHSTLLALQYLPDLQKLEIPKPQF